MIYLHYIKRGGILTIPEHKAVVYMGDRLYMWGKFIMDWRRLYPSCKSVIIYDKTGISTRFEDWGKFDDDIFRFLGWTGDYFMPWVKDYYLRVIFETVEYGNVDKLMKVYDTEGTLFVYDSEPTIKPKNGMWMVVE